DALGQQVTRAGSSRQKSGTAGLAAMPEIRCAGRTPPRSVDAQLLELVAQGAEGDAQRGGGLGLVVAVLLQGLLDGGAFDLLDVGGQGAAGGVEGAGLPRVGAGRGID